MAENRQSEEAVDGTSLKSESEGMSAATQTQAPTAQSVLSSWIATDPRSVKLLEDVRRIADSTTTVLISGESGSGKDLLALVLHYLGAHAEQPLIKIDCATLPLELVESELFGYEKGAFTGATHMKRGRLELAGLGTVVLDEVAGLSLAMQAKLLRVIEEKRFERLGGSRPLTLEARIIALTSVDLEQAVARRSFREDLFYRLNVIPVSIPALRERPADIPPLAERFLVQLGEVHRRPRLKFATEVLPALEAYSYPGNVRELRNLVERAVISCTPPEVKLEDFPAQIGQANIKPTRSFMTLEELERAHIEEVLDAVRGKKGEAAKILGISRKTLLEKRKRYKLD